MKLSSLAIICLVSLVSPRTIFAADLSTRFSSLPCTPTNNANLTITGGSSGTNLSLGTSSQWAGSISSLKINGVETLANNDPGLLMQYAFQLGGTNEAENPTEGGGAGSNPSSSTFIEGCSSGKIIYTKSQMAYWFPYNSQVLSPFTMSKIVEIGANNIPGLIRFIVKIHSPGASKGWQLETPTGYHTPNFNQLTIFDQSTNTLRTLNQSEYTHLNIEANDYMTQNMIVISNGTHSFVPYMTNLEQHIPIWPGRYYFAKFNTFPVVKWSIMTYKNPDSSPNDYYYESYLLVSPNDQVLNNISAMLHMNNLSPIGHLDTVTASGNIYGWAADKDFSPIPIHFYLDNTYEQGGKLIGTTTASLARPDVLGVYGYGSTSGFSFQIPAEYLKTNRGHKIYAYAINFNIKGAAEGAPTLITPNGVDIPLSEIGGDFNSDGKVNSADYTLFIAGFGTKYTVIDYADLVANYGK